jgi:ketosteroid isomerase-like protein
MSVEAHPTLVRGDRDELRRLQHDWMRAVQARDMDRLEDLVADGFRFTAVHLHPEPMTRDQWMDAARGGYTIVTFAYEDMEIEVFGDTGVVHSRYSQIASFATVSLSNLFRLTDVWARMNGRWWVVARHSSVYG